MWTNLERPYMIMMVNQMREIQPPRLVLIFFCYFWFALLRMKEDLFCDLAF